MFSFYAFKLISTSIEIPIIPKPQGFWHTFKNPHPLLLFSKSPESLLGIQQVEGEVGGGRGGEGRILICIW